MEYQAGQEDEEPEAPQPKQRGQQGDQQAEDGAGDGEGPEGDGPDAEDADAEDDEGPVNNQQGQVTTAAFCPTLLDDSQNTFTICKAQKFCHVADPSRLQQACSFLRSCP